MTYFGFLLRFVGVPILALALLNAWDRRRGRRLPASLGTVAPWVAIGAHCLIAVVYTTPWDNYLVATQVWWYDPRLVCGVVLGWVPLEEYTFFVVQTVLTGLLLLAVARRLPCPPRPAYRSAAIRVTAVLGFGVVWAASVAVLAAGWRPGTYGALTFGWLLIPIMIQLGFGADILWRYREIVGATIAIASLYLGVADGLAIHSGTWVISPEQTVGLLLFGVLPLEEFLFFVQTNVLVVFGVTLLLAAESHERLRAILTRVSRRGRRAGSR